MKDFYAKQLADMQAKYPVGSAVRWSDYATRPLRDAYLNQGQPQRRASYKQAYDEKCAERGVVLSVDCPPNGVPGIRAQFGESVVSALECRLTPA